MKYWMLFTLRLMSRVGLCLSISLAVLVWWTPVLYSTPPGMYHLEFYAGKSYVRCELMAPLFRSLVAENLHLSGRVVSYPGFGLYVIGSRVELSFDHWLLCLTFLIATIATSVRWRMKPAADAEQERADE